MSVQYGKLCSLVIVEHFGEVVRIVAQDLFKEGPKTVPQIVATTKLRRSKVTESLRILIQHGFVSFIPTQHRTDIAEYTFLPEKVLLMLRYVRYMLLVKTQYGNEAELLVEELLRHGNDRASCIILRATSRLKEIKKDEKVTIGSVRDKLIVLMNKQFIMRCPIPGTEENNKVPTFTINSKYLYTPPHLNLTELSKLERGLSAEPGDDDIFLRVNFDRFHQEFRDQIMISAMKCRIDENAGELMRILLQQMYLRTDAWAATSNPIPLAEIRDGVHKMKNSCLKQYLDQYLNVLGEDSGRFITKAAESSGGQFVVHIKEAFIELSWAAIESIVEERFGSKAARVFRLIKSKSFIEQEQIQQYALIPAKEGKLITYKLLEEGFIQIQELRKSFSAGGPNKTFFLFHIDLEQVVRKTLEICYKALYNSITRRHHEKNEHERLIEKQKRIASVTANLREQGAPAESITELEELITPLENEQLEKVRITITRLGEAELQLDDNMFLLQLYLMYRNS